MTRRRFVVLPDIHFPYQCDDALEAAFKVIDLYQPHDIFQIGDILDCYDISRYDKSPERRLDTLQEEINEAVSFFDILRCSYPKSRIFFCEGNHEHRLHKLKAALSGLGSLDDLNWRHLLRLDALNIHHCGYLEHHAPYGPSLVIRHGHSARKHSGRSAQAELESAHREFLCSGISGHTHRTGKFCKTVAGHAYWWIEAGHLASRDVSKEYSPNMPDWQQGLVIGFFDEKAGGPHAWICKVENGEAILPPIFGSMS
jgi:hypothetical protein